MTTDLCEDFGLMSAFEFLGWVEKAQGNLKKWGLQDEATLIECMTEEMGEVAKAHLQFVHECGDYSRIREEVGDLAALCLQIAYRLLIEEEEKCRKD